MTAYSSLSHAAVHVPPGRQTVAEAEDRFRTHSPDVTLTRGVLRHMYGLLERTVADADEQPSDLAAHAALKLFESPGVAAADDIDLLIFTGILADMEEPATAHVVADKLGLKCPVFDLKNACNGVLNAIEVADAFIKAGQYRRVLITTAEVSTRESRWSVAAQDDVLTALPSLSTGDMGSALLMEASERPGVLGSRFFANSWGWPAATLPNPYARDRTLGHLHIDSSRLVASFEGLPQRMRGAVRDIGVSMADLDLVCIHQPSVAFTKVACDWVGVDVDRIQATFPTHGNVATNTIPLQLATALESGRLQRGDLVGLFGFASGASAGVVVCSW
ncbi:3-oxoacyl-[acyl-carrier-protein] synthase III C-terminal domain-containing protein [Streptomyces sp. NPDC050264]|uniref:3-oxoacyl-ACP synthase III family protein n=1 Tax=Streptomyces sp. NPDC050264 TaxID=3155038 RepID=UPI0034245321